jgi:thiamine biosynthesis lipoprotein
MNEKTTLTRRHALHLGLGLLCAPAAGAPRLQWRERVLLGFGTTLWLRAAHADGARADAALDAAVQALRHVERQMSLFDPDSALSRLNRDGALDAPDTHLVAVLRLARRVAAASNGAFDISVQPLWAAWQRAHAEQRLPTHAELAAARARVDWRAVHLTPGRITLRRPGMALTLNGIAQGYAADLARTALRAHGITHALLDTGEWATLGRAPAGEPWSLGIADPRDTQRVVARIEPRGRAVATSSDAQLAFTADRREHHIVDPRSGHSPPQLASVTVAASSAALADALTKVVFMAGWAQGLQAARRWGADALIVDKSGRWKASAGLVA